MSDTPRTDRNYVRGFEALMSHTKDEDEWVRAEFARQLERENAALRTLTSALWSAVQPFIKQVPLDKWKAITDACAAAPEQP